MKRLLAVLALAAACEGPTGPAGPAGAQGPQGIAGPAGPAGPQGTTKLTFTGQLAPAGTATADLPAAAGTLNAPPTFACYLAWDVNGTIVWAEVGDHLFDPNYEQSCIIGNGPSGALRIVLTGGQGGQSYAIIVVY